MLFRKEGEEDFSLDLTPMIDVVFLLLIFFMVSTSFIDFSRRMDISLPEAKASVTADKIKNYVIEIGLDKKIFLNGTEMDFNTLEKRLKEKKEELGIKKAVVVRADEKLDYGLIVKIMGIVNAAEITDLSIAVK
ncbi:MAG TPA: biopolymer transporter ExbD [Nitrospinota bacterium]|jgi:biopolymer transport protein ExbD|nr:biopolymer transporter ExbD [Nitrospinota bacterium]